LDHRPILDPAMPKPLGGYSQVVRAGELLFVSGQPGIVPETGQPADGGFEAEARQAFANLQAILEAAGSGLAHVVKTTTFVAHSEDVATANRLFGECFPTDPPARSTPIVGLPRGLLFSIEAIAVVSRSDARQGG
jgi:2-iminobutanoate/2-iminopropanoate deaminase